MPHNVGRTAATKASNSARQERSGTTTKSVIRGRPRTAAGSVRRRGRQASEGNMTLCSSLSNSTDVHGTINTLSDDTLINDSRQVENAPISLPKPNNDTVNVEKQEDGVEVAITEADDELYEVKFVIPERQQTAEDFDIRKFLVDVDQLAASLRAVVHRQAAEDFEGDSLAQMVSAVVGTMHNFKTFGSRVCNSLETIRDQMKSATDFMRHKILQPTELDILAFKGRFQFVSVHC